MKAKPLSSLMKQIQISDFKLAEILNRVPFFKKFSIAERKAFFASNMTFVRCRGGDYILTQGDKETDFYIVLSGKGCVLVNNGQDKVAEVKAGYFLGEGAFINSQPHSASVKAEVETYLLKLDQRALMRFPASIREKVKDQIISGMAMRLGDMNERSLLK